MLVAGSIQFQYEEEKWRGLRSSRAQVAGPGIRFESSFSERIPDPAVPGRYRTAGTSPYGAIQLELICVYLRDLRFLLESGSGSIWVICGLMAGFVISSCLCVFVVATDSRKISVIPLCLCGFAGEPLASVAVDLTMPFFGASEPLAPDGGGFKQTRHGRWFEPALFYSIEEDR